MDIFLTISGFIIGISLFLYLLSFADAGKRHFAVQQKAGRTEAEALTVAKTTMPNMQGNIKRGEENRSIPALSENINGHMPARSCPMCGKSLAKDEPLYASHMNIGNEKKVFIHGCPYCYKSNYKIS